MRVTRFAIALVAGALLYYAAAVYLGGFMAARQVPLGFFEYFGRANADVAMAISTLAMFTLPVGAAVAFGVVGCVYVLAGNRTLVLLGIALGLAAGSLLVQWLYPVPGSDGSVFRSLFIILSSAWYAPMAWLAPWLGLAAGSWFLLRQPAVPHRAEA